ncbi:hypothetical protein BGZ80_009187 [Entomortierella chlamydospora]|uniref:LIM zinc-binding domain-containing protein n=1 Tax=Entomortierella chlamydospora TaxID=101097 RepID=A0A9P6MWL8_9FUNG|nr:hypothetical protein BGZ79_003019 [Entomortierella chlamydospora]KAG0016492.1 hypothetical protein BGZ80_009187 [Entomortierella chlamydospora]
MSSFTVQLPDPRLSKILPVIHCSDCGQDVEYRKLSNHNCIYAPAMPIIPLSLSTQPTSPSDSITTTDRYSIQKKIPSVTKSTTTNTSPLSLIRSASQRSRPALPYLEKYSKRKSTSAPAILSQTTNLGRNSLDSNVNRNSQQGLSQQQQKRALSPIIAAALSDSDQDLVTPRASIDERSSPLTSGRFSPDIDQNKHMMETICNYPVRPARASQQLPLVPKKSAARTSGIAPRRGLEISTDNSKQTLLTTGQSSDARIIFELDQEREREWEKSNRSTPPAIASSAANGLTRPNSFESISSSSSWGTKCSLLERSGSALAMNSLRPERPKRQSSPCQSEQSRYSNELLSAQRQKKEPRQILSPSTTASGESSPRSSTSTYTTHSPPLSPLDELVELEIVNEPQEIEYRPPTPKSSSPSPIPPKDSLSEELKEDSSETQSESDVDVDQFETLMENILLEIKIKAMPALKCDSSRTTRTQVVETVNPARKRVTSPSPDPIPAQTTVVRRADNDRNYPSILSKSTEPKVLCRADDTRKRPQSPTPVLTKTTKATEETRGSLTPAQPRSTRRSEDIRKSPSPVPPQPRAVRQLEDIQNSTLLQTTTVRQTGVTSPTPAPRVKATHRIDIVESAPLSPELRPNVTREAHRTDLVDSTPLSPRLRPNATRETEVTSCTKTVKSAPLSPPLQPKVTRETYRSNVVESTPLSSRLRPNVARRTEATNRTEAVKSAPLSPPLRAKVPRETRRTEGVESAPLSPLRPRASRETEVTCRTKALKSAPLSPPLHPKVSRELRRNEVVESTPSSPPHCPRVTRETEAIKSSPTQFQTRRLRQDENLQRSTTPPPTQFQTRRLRQDEDLQRSTTPPPLQPRAARRSVETRDSPSQAPVQSKATRRTSPLPLTNKLKQSFRQSEDVRSPPPPPAPEPQPMISRRSNETRNQRSVKEDKERVEKTSGSVIRSDKTETSEKSKKTVKVTRFNHVHEQEREQEQSDHSFEREHSRGPTTRSEPIGKVNKELDRSPTSRSVARNQSTKGRGGIERCADCKNDIQPSELADSIKMAYGSYHSECMKCSQCRVFIPSSLDAHEFEGHLLCENDYAKMLEKEVLRPQRRRICAGCETPIESTDQVVYALGKPWHEHHLFCYHCLKPIREAHMEKSGRVYCVRDYNELFLPKCKACGLKIESNIISAKDNKLTGKWHADCFRCRTCRREFPDMKFYVFKDQPYCKRHYHRLNNSMCMRCDEPIEGHCAQTMEVRQK